MKITHLLSNLVVITRLQTVTGDKQAYSTVTSVSGNIQALSEQKSSLVDGVFGKTFKIYVDGETDIRAGDRLKDEKGNYYTVKSDGATRKTFGSFDFRQIVIEKTF